jgi:hypothetical protein
MPAALPELAIELTDGEKVLVSCIDFNLQAGADGADSWRPIADAMEEIMRSLLERKAIPSARLLYVTAPQVCMLP